LNITFTISHHQASLHLSSSFPTQKIKESGGPYVAVPFRPKLNILINNNNIKTMMNLMELPADN
jgi:hypothetical protein